MMTPIHLLFVVLAVQVRAELVGNGVASPAAAPAEIVKLAECRIPEDVRDKNGERVSGIQEGAARKAAQRVSLDSREVLARLIYSETLSTGYWQNRCEAPSSEQIMETIGWGIMYRVKKEERTSDPYYNAIFKPDQFRTSFKPAKKSASSPGTEPNDFAHAFLCPLSVQPYLDNATKKDSAEGLYRQAQKIADQIVSEYGQTGIPAKYTKISNFFYPRSEVWGEIRPAWALDRDPTKNKGFKNLLGSQNPCVEFYEL